MSNTINSMTNYYSILRSPVSSSLENTNTNFMYNAIMSNAYSQSFAKKVQSTMSAYLGSLNSNITDLKTSAKALSGKGADSTFEQKAVSASDSNAAVATAANNADQGSYTLNISKLATVQSNSGIQLKSNDTTTFALGQNTLMLNTEGKQKALSFTVNETDTNKTSLDKMAKAVNDAKTGVIASVVNDSTKGTSYLKLTSDRTGAGNTFNISDTTGNASSTAGANTVTVQAQNAEYTVDGKYFSSQENVVKIDDGKIQVVLKKAEGKDIKLVAGPDTNSMKSDIEGFIEDYNNTMSFANTSSTSFNGASRLGKELDGIIQSRKYSLERMGITKNSDGTLSIDSKKLEHALKNELTSVKDTFGSSNGLADKLNMKSNEVLSAPLQYAKPVIDTNSYTLDRNKYNIQNMFRGMVVDMML